MAVLHRFYCTYVYETVSIIMPTNEEGGILFLVQIPSGIGVHIGSQNYMLFTVFGDHGLIFKVTAEFK